VPAPSARSGGRWIPIAAGREPGLVVPGNITLLALPPYSPELNPVEQIWHYLRSHWLANSVFRSLADIMDACEMAWNRFARL
jgi:transposase